MSDHTYSHHSIVKRIVSFITILNYLFVTLAVSMPSYAQAQAQPQEHSKEKEIDLSWAHELDEESQAVLKADIGHIKQLEEDFLKTGPNPSGYLNEDIVRRNFAALSMIMRNYELLAEKLLQVGFIEKATEFNQRAKEVLNTHMLPYIEKMDKLIEEDLKKYQQLMQIEASDDPQEAKALLTLTNTLDESLFAMSMVKKKISQDPTKPRLETVQAIKDYLHTEEKWSQFNNDFLKPALKQYSKALEKRRDLLKKSLKLVSTFGGTAKSMEDLSTEATLIQQEMSELTDLLLANGMEEEAYENHNNGNEFFKEYLAPLLGNQETNEKLKECGLEKVSGGLVPKVTKELYESNCQDDYQSPLAGPFQNMALKLSGEDLSETGDGNQKNKEVKDPKKMQELAELIYQDSRRTIINQYWDVHSRYRGPILDPISAIKQATGGKHPLPFDEELKKDLERLAKKNKDLDIAIETEQSKELARGDLIAVHGHTQEIRALAPQQTRVHHIFRQAQWIDPSDRTWEQITPRDLTFHIERRQKLHLGGNDYLILPEEGSSGSSVQWPWPLPRDRHPAYQEATARPTLLTQPVDPIFEALNPHLASDQSLQVTVAPIDTRGAEIQPILTKVLKLDVEGWSPSFLSGDEAIAHAKENIILPIYPEADDETVKKWLANMRHRFLSYGQLTEDDQGQLVPLQRDVPPSVIYQVVTESLDDIKRVQTVETPSGTVQLEHGLLDFPQRVSQFHTDQRGLHQARLMKNPMVYAPELAKFIPEGMSEDDTYHYLTDAAIQNSLNQYFEKVPEYLNDKWEMLQEDPEEFLKFHIRRDPHSIGRMLAYDPDSVALICQLWIELQKEEIEQKKYKVNRDIALGTSAGILAAGGLLLCATGAGCTAGLPLILLALSATAGGAAGVIHAMEASEGFELARQIENIMAATGQGDPDELQKITEKAISDRNWAAVEIIFAIIEGATATAGFRASGKTAQVAKLSGELIELNRESARLAKIIELSEQAGSAISRSVRAKAIKDLAQTTKKIGETLDRLKKIQGTVSEGTKLGNRLTQLRNFGESTASLGRSAAAGTIQAGSRASVALQAVGEGLEQVSGQGKNIAAVLNLEKSAEEVGKLSKQITTMADDPAKAAEVAQLRTALQEQIEGLAEQAKLVQGLEGYRNTHLAGKIASLVEKLKSGTHTPEQIWRLSRLLIGRSRALARLPGTKGYIRSSFLADWLREAFPRLVKAPAKAVGRVLAKPARQAYESMVKPITEPLRRVFGATSEAAKQTAAPVADFIGDNFRWFTGRASAGLPESLRPLMSRVLKGGIQSMEQFTEAERALMRLHRVLPLFERAVQSSKMTKAWNRLVPAAMQFVKATGHYGSFPLRFPLQKLWQAGMWIKQKEPFQVLRLYFGQYLKTLDADSFVIFQKVANNPAIELTEAERLHIQAKKLAHMLEKWRNVGSKLKSFNTAVAAYRHTHTHYLKFHGLLRPLNFITDIIPKFFFMPKLPGPNSAIARNLVLRGAQVAEEVKLPTTFMGHLAKIPEHILVRPINGLINLGQRVINPAAKMKTAEQRFIDFWRLADRMEDYAKMANAAPGPFKNVAQWGQKFRRIIWLMASGFAGANYAYNEYNTTPETMDSSSPTGMDGSEPKVELIFYSPLPHMAIRIDGTIYNFGIMEVEQLSVAEAQNSVGFGNMFSGNLVRVELKLQPEQKEELAHYLSGKVGDYYPLAFPFNDCVSETNQALQKTCSIDVPIGADRSQAATIAFFKALKLKEDLAIARGDLKDNQRIVGDIIYSAREGHLGGEAGSKAVDALSNALDVKYFAQNAPYAVMGSAVFDEALPSSTIAPEKIPEYYGTAQEFYQQNWPWLGERMDAIRNRLGFLQDRSDDRSKLIEEQIKRILEQGQGQHQESGR